MIQVFLALQVPGGVGIAFFPELVLIGVLRRVGVELAVPLETNIVEKAELAFEEIDMAVFVREKLLEQIHGNIIAGLLANLARALVGGAGVVFAGKIGLQHFLDVLANA